jgi:photosystem II stability/assembly factor-like uncharacterized protein
MGPLVCRRSAIVTSFILFFLLLATMFAVAQQANRVEEEREPADLQQAREQVLQGRHSVPAGESAAALRLKAVQQKSAMQAQQRAAFASAQTATTAATLSTGTWTAVGPAPISWLTGGAASGRIAELAVDPRNSSVVYAGTGEGGVWKTTDAGATWTALTDQQSSLAIGSITLDPNNPDIVYVGTGEGLAATDQYDGNGILKSTDAGHTWTHITGPFAKLTFGAGGAHISSLAVQPTNSSVLVATVRSDFSSDDGFWRSTDAGITWSHVHSCPLPRKVRFLPGTATALASCGLQSTGGLFRSTDGGSTWTKIGSGLPDPNNALDFAFAPSNPNIVYAGYEYLPSPTASPVASIFKSTDGGNTFTQLANAPAFCNQCVYATALAVSPANPNIVFAGGLDIWRSLDGGNSWADVLITSGTGGNVHPDMHSAVFDSTGSKLYLGSDGGVYSTTDFVGTPNNASFTALPWQNLNSTLNTALLYPGMSIDPNNVNLAFVGTQDNSTLRYTAPNWQSVVCGDGGYTVAPGNGTVYASCFEGIFIKNQIFKSTANGTNTSWTQMPAPTNESQVNVIAPLVGDTTNANRLYFGAQHVFVTNDGAQTWTAISPNFGTPIANIAVAPNNPQVVWTLTQNSGNIHVTQNALAGTGATWSSALGVLPHFRTATALAVDPHNPLTGYATYAGFSGFDDTGHVFKSTDGGKTWSDISSNLPNIPTNAIVVDPDNAGSLYVGTDIGVFFSTDGGASWNPMGAGLPNAIVTWLTLHEATRTLRASTHGRGAWDIALPAAGSPPPPPTGCTASTVGVTICSPAAGATVSSPVDFQAAAKGNTAITAMRAYLDGAQVAGSPSGTIGASLNPSAGTHSLIVNAWDTTGTLYQTKESFTVGSAPPPPPPSGCSTTAVGVKICTPANGSSVSSPVQVSAAAQGNKPITAMKVYLDGVLAASGSSGAITASLNAAAGTHTLNVNAWDTSGTVYTAVSKFSVGGAPPPPPPSCTASTVGVTVCSPSAGATVTSPFSLVAAAKGNKPITAMKAYLSGVQVAASSSATLSASITGSAGTRTLIVQAWDTAGTVYKTTLTITIK